MSSVERFQKLTQTGHLKQGLRARSVRATAQTAGTSMADMAIRIGSTAILARLIIPEHFGLVMMVTAVTAVADQLREMGLSSATVQQKEITHHEVSNLFWINTGVGLLLALLACAMSPLLASYYQDGRVIIVTCVLAVNFVLGGMMVQHQALLTRQLKLGTTSAVRLGSSIVSTLLAIVLAYLDFGFWALVWREVSRAALLTIGMWLCFPWLPSLPSRRTSVRKYLGFGANLTGANVLGTISSGVDRFLLGRFGGTAQVAIYRQAYQLMTAPTDQLAAPIYQVSQPVLSLLQNDAQKFRLFYLKIVVMVSILTMPLSLYIIVYAHEITMVVLGPDWIQAAPILSILSVGTLIKQVTSSTMLVPISRGDGRSYLVIMLLRNLIQVVLMVVSVRWGAIGIAVAEVAATYIMVPARLKISLRNSPITPRDFFSAFTRPALASLGLGLELYVFHSFIVVPSLIMAVLVGAIITPFLFFATWWILPGGRAELLGLIADIRLALRGGGIGAITTGKTSPA